MICSKKNSSNCCWWQIRHKPTLKVIRSHESYWRSKMTMKLTIIIVSLILIAIAIICTLKIERAYNGFYNFLTYSVYLFDVVACIIGVIAIIYALKKVVQNYAWILIIIGWMRFTTLVFGSPRTPNIRRNQMDLLPWFNQTNPLLRFDVEDHVFLMVKYLYDLTK